MVKIITGTLEDYGKLEDTFFQIYYIKQKYLTKPRHLNMISEDEYDNTFSISAQYPETEICKGDSVVFFFWEGKEDKSLMTKLTCMEYDVNKESVINQPIYMIDFSKAFTMELSIPPGSIIESEVGTPFDFSSVIKVKSHYNYLYKDNDIFFQDTSKYEFFNIEDWLKNELYINNKLINEGDSINEIGSYSLTGLISIFQFEFSVDFIYEVVEKKPIYSVTWDPINPKIEEIVEFNVFPNYLPSQLKNINFYYNDELLDKYEVNDEPIPDEFSIFNKKPKARPYGIFKIETIYFDGVKTSIQESIFNIFYTNKTPIVKLSNKSELENSNFSTRNFNIFIDSKSAKTMFIKWSLKIDQNPDWIFLFLKEIFNFDDYTEISDLKVLPIEILEVTGKLRAEIVVEDAFGDIGSDYVEFDNYCSKYEAKSVSLLSSSVY
jgi:hypothetical protein